MDSHIKPYDNMTTKNLVKVNPIDEYFTPSE